MDFNTTLDAIINNVNSNQDTLRSLLAQLQLTTITSSDDELYEAPTLNETTGLWTLAQSTANVDGMYVGCYKLPITGIDSLVRNVTIISHSNPASPNVPATVAQSTGSPVDLSNIADLQGRVFNSFCIRSATPFEITLRINAQSPAGCSIVQLGSFGNVITDNGDCTFTITSNTPHTNGRYYCSVGRHDPTSDNDFSQCAVFTFIAQASGTGTAASQGPCGSNSLNGWNIGGPTSPAWVIQIEFLTPFEVTIGVTV